MLQSITYFYCDLLAIDRVRTGPLASPALARWSGLVGLSAMWAATSNVEEGSRTDEEANGPLADGEQGLYFKKLFAGVPIS